MLYWHDMELDTMAQPIQTPVIPFIDDVSDNAKSNTINNSTSSPQKPFEKPPKWSFGLLKLLLTILMRLLVDSPDIQLNFYMITIMF